MSEREAQLLTVLKALISDIESMQAKSNPDWFEGFSAFEWDDDDTVSVEWPNLKISLEEAKKQVSHYNGIRE